MPEGDVYAAFPNVIHDGRRFPLQYTTVDREARWYRTRMASATDFSHWEPLPDLQWENDPLPFQGAGMITHDVVPKRRVAAQSAWLFQRMACRGVDRSINPCFQWAATEPETARGRPTQDGLLRARTCESTITDGRTRAIWRIRCAASAV